jgi:protein-disulfide isomerase
MKRAFPFVIIIAVLAGGLAMAWYLTRSSADTPRRSSPGILLTKTPLGTAKLGADPPQTLGSPDAPVMLEEFGDFECAPCASLHPVLKMMKAEFGSRVVIVFREFPMVSLHPHALPAARAAEAAGLQGKFWEMHNLLYQNQKTWHEASDAGPIFEQYATTIGLDLDRFKRDITSEAIDQRIRLDRERGTWIGVNSTPTVFLNGREVPPESLSSDKLRALIRAQPASETNRD